MAVQNFCCWSPASITRWPCCPAAPGRGLSVAAHLQSLRHPRQPAPGPPPGWRAPRQAPRTPPEERVGVG